MMVPCLSKVIWKQIGLEVGVEKVLNYSLYNQVCMESSEAGGDVHTGQNL